MSEPAPDSIICNGCLRTYKWKPEYAGKNARCKCGQMIAFPVDNPAKTAAAGGEYGLVEPPPVQTVALEPPVQTAPPAPPANVKMTACKGCTAMIPADSVVCTNCGMHQKTGKKLGTKVKGPGPEAADVAKAAGKVALSIVLGGVTAVVCAILWLLIIIFTGFTIGYIAIGVGLATGYVMRLMNREGSTGSGFAAAAFAILSFGLVKLGLMGILVLAHQPASHAFRPFDVLWVTLAASSAYKLGLGEGVKTTW